MNNAVFSFSKPARGSTVVSNHLARFIAKTLDLPLYYDKRIRDERLDILFIVNGAYAFCDCLADLAPAIRRATRIVWIQNDYTIKPPRFDVECKAESPFRRAFVVRAASGKLPTDYWTTVEANSQVTPDSMQMNWNALMCLKMYLEPAWYPTRDLFYYGAYRVQRRHTFDIYFIHPSIPVTISSTSKKFLHMYPDTHHMGGLQHGNGFYQALNSHGLGLYIEDPKSHSEWHSPANRFYEMLSAGLPMVFEPMAALMLDRHGIQMEHEYVIDSQVAIKHAFKNRVVIATKQQTMWFRSYHAELRQYLLQAYKHLIWRHTHGR
jgi:hypothetical protein